MPTERESVRVPQVCAITVTGRLTRDPELQYLTTGTALCKMGIAHNRKFKGEEEVSFFDVTCWGKLAELVGEHLKKGRPVMVMGELRQRSWEQDGQTRKGFEINADKVEGLSWGTDYEDPKPGDAVSVGGIKGRVVETVPASQEDDLPF